LSQLHSLYNVELDWKIMINVK